MNELSLGPTFEQLVIDFLWAHVDLRDDAGVPITVVTVEEDDYSERVYIDYVTESSVERTYTVDANLYNFLVDLTNY